MPPRTLNAVVEVAMSSGGLSDLRVLLERKTDRSDGMESMPQEGTMMAPVFVAG